MGKVALVIIYNHRFDRNIDLLEEIYKDRFSNIFHLMPFYDGNKPNVIPVYENSFYFQGYVTQGLGGFFDDKFDHYFFIGDDLIINPKINEHNYTEEFKLKPESSFIPELISLHSLNNHWPRIKEAYEFKRPLLGAEIDSELPSYEEALEHFKKYNLAIEPLKHEQLFKKPNTPKNENDLIAKNAYDLEMNNYNSSLSNTYSLEYPLVGAYSDIFIVSRQTIKKFAHYCGVFAAGKLFIELALPTAMVMTAKDLVVGHEIELKGRALWVKEDFEILDKYEQDFKKLMNDFPPLYLYLHPIKLSQWKTQNIKSLS